MGFREKQLELRNMLGMEQFNFILHSLSVKYRSQNIEEPYSIGGPPNVEEILKIVIVNLFTKHFLRKGQFGF